MKTTKSARAMKAAWTNARKAAARFGGKAGEYFVSCLKEAWAWVKSTASNHLIGTVVRETAKAVMVRWNLELMHANITADVWFPKSQLQNGCAPAWLMKEKERELAAKYRYICAIEIL